MVLNRARNITISKTFIRMWWWPFSNYRFILILFGFPGNSHDSIIFQSTNLWADIKEKGIIPSIAKNENGTLIPPIILGDSAFPFQTWLMKPYGNAVLTPEQRYFNYRLSRARMVTEGCSGQLKGRWRILLRKCENSKDEMKATTLACMVLHDICIDNGDTISSKLNLTVDPSTIERRDSAQIRELLMMTSCEKMRDSSHQHLSYTWCTCEDIFLGKTNRWGLLNNNIALHVITLHCTLLCSTCIIGILWVPYV